MKIDGTHLADDLLQRMQEAHEQRTEAAPGVEGGKGRFELGQTAGVSAPAEVPSTEAPPLQTRLRETAQKALRGEFPDADAVRNAVVEEIVRDRWNDRLGSAKVRKLVRSMKETLGSDPEFSRQVDEMLILAARDLGTEGKR